MYAKLITGGLAPRKGHPVVTGYHNESIVEFSNLLQLLQHPAKVLVKPLDMHCVVQQVAANLRRIRVKRRHLRIGELLAFPQADTLLKDAVRVPAAIPETERAALRPLVQEFLEVAGIIGIGDSLGTALMDILVVCHTRRIAATPGDFPVRGTTALAGEADVIAVTGEYVRIDLQLPWPGRMIHRGLFQTIERHTRQYR